MKIIVTACITNKTKCTKKVVKPKSFTSDKYQPNFLIILTHNDCPYPNLQLNSQLSE